MVNTGYILLDGTGIDIATASATVEGIYANTLAAIDTGKVIYLTNIVNGDSKFSPMPVYGFASGENITIYATGKTLVIANNDAVTIS